MTQYRFECTNCMLGWHETPYCPYRRPQPPAITPERMAAAGRLLQLEREGVIDLTPFRRSMFWWVPRALAVLLVFVVLVILI
ncbi:hypothetical protein [Nocardia gipuzkoensis]|uniref:hypothetical protein n=1 Tax=Nocardia gipuzkoensis TaxID=2749991 RepID=UPI0015EFA313|nr:hypothetical protein [Nocardia gipuzkoensis]